MIETFHKYTLLVKGVGVAYVASEEGVTHLQCLSRPRRAEGERVPRTQNWLTEITGLAKITTRSKDMTGLMQEDRDEPGSTSW